MKNRILLTFDLEEFDLPLEFGCPISEQDQIEVTNRGLQNLTGLLSEQNIPATFFTTSFYAGKNKELVKNLATGHEIASHSKHHSDFRESDPLDSKLEIEQITGKQVNGFRIPRFSKIDKGLLTSAGYKYDSSVNPTFIPGRYNNLSANRKLHKDPYSNLVIFPVSVTSVIRFPLFWLSFKNLPLQIYMMMCRNTLKKDSYLHLYFHPWEFDDLSQFKIPGYIKKPSGDSFTRKFEKMLVSLKKAGEFSTVSGFIESSGPF